MNSRGSLTRANSTGVTANNIVSIGKVVALDEKEAKNLKPQDNDIPPFQNDVPRVLVQIGGTEIGTYTRTWMPWVMQRAGIDTEWWAPEIEEQVLVVSISGNPALGIIIGSIYRGDHFQFGLPVKATSGKTIDLKTKLPDSSINRDMWQRIHGDGTAFTYNRYLHQFSLDVRDNKPPEKKGEKSTEQERKKSAETARGKSPALLKSTIEKNELDLKLWNKAKDKLPSSELTSTPNLWHQKWRKSGDKEETVAENKIEVKGSGTKLTAKVADSEKKGIYLDASSDGALTINTTKNTTILIGEKNNPKIKIKYDAEGGGDFTVETEKNVNIKAAKTVSITAKNIKIKGDTEIDGELTVKKKAQLKSGAAIQGNVNINGKLDVK